MKVTKLLYFICPWILQHLIWIPTRLILVICGHIEVRGKENLDSVPANAIFACNHASEADVFLIPGILPPFSRFLPIFYTSREQSFYIKSGWRQRFYGGIFFNIWGAYPVKVGMRDYAKSLETHKSIICQGGSLCIFPEGRATHDGNLQPGKGGVAYLSYATGRPIVPVRLGGMFRLNVVDLLLGRRKLSISFGEPLYVAAKNGLEPSFEDFKIYANIIMYKIKAMAREPKVVLVPEPKPTRFPRRVPEMA